MAFNIQQFQSEFGSKGHGVTNLFTVQILTSPVTGSLERDLVFFANATDLPAFDIETTNIAHSGFGTATRKPTGLQYPILPITFFVDKDHKILRFFHEWIRQIVNYDRSEGPLGSVNGLRPFEIGYKSDYQGAIKVTVFSRYNGGDTYVYEFSGAYPINMGTVSMSWDSEGIMSLPVGFTYDVVNITSLPTPLVTGSGGGANSLLTYLSQLNTSIEVFRSIDLPRDVRGLVNQSAAILDDIF